MDESLPPRKPTNARSPLAAWLKNSLNVMFSFSSLNSVRYKLQVRFKLFFQNRNLR